MTPENSALLITYYWPPAGGAGVHRWLRLSKYFKENGWKLHVYCPENAAWPIIDNELTKEVAKEIKIIRRPIFEPHKYLGKKNNPNVSGGFTRNNKSTVLQKLIIWIRGNIFIPDARVFWIRPSYRYLNTYLKNNSEISTIISTGPPHSLHLIARKLKRTNKHLKWIADYRDPWTEIDFYKDLVPGKFADKLQHKLEKSCLIEPDAVVTISESSAISLEKIGNRKVEVITNGYNFPFFDEKTLQLDSKFTIAHYGSMSFSRNPEIIWKALSDLCTENPNLREDLEIKLIGPVDYTVIERIKHYSLINNLLHIPLVSHNESIEMQRKSQIMLLVANNTGNVKGILTGKFFEYLGAKRPILAIGEKNSDLENAINETESGVFIDYENYTLAKQTILEWYNSYKNNTLLSQSKNLTIFSTETLAKKYCDLMTNIQTVNQKNY